MENYDSTEDTLAHIRRVAELLSQASENLLLRGRLHDASKLESPEKEGFDTFTPLLKDCEYGSPEYYEFLKGLKPALDHHYANNSHHPEFYSNGVNDMSLLDLTEMVCDWKASGERMSSGNIYKSIEINKKRFNISPQLEAILINTAREMFPEVEVPS